MPLFIRGMGNLYWAQPKYGEFLENFNAPKI